MTEAKFKDIVNTMIEMNLIDPDRAILDQDYLLERVNLYIEAANIVREGMHMEPLV